NEIAQQTRTLSDKLTEINETSAEFKAAVAARAQCTFDQVFAFVGCILTLGIEAYGAISGVLGAIRELRGLEKEAKEFKDTIKEIKETGASIGEFKKTWAETKDLLTKEQPDLAKIAIQKEDFDDEIAPFLEMEEARTYKRRVHEYLSTVQTRNAK